MLIQILIYIMSIKYQTGTVFFWFSDFHSLFRVETCIFFAWIKTVWKNNFGISNLLNESSVALISCNTKLIRGCVTSTNTMEPGTIWQTIFPQKIQNYFYINISDYFSSVITLLFHIADINELVKLKCQCL